MKKYIKPASTEMELRYEGVVAASINVTYDPNKQTDDNFSHRRGWDSADWTTNNEEE